MQFKEEFIPKIISGEKTQTRRLVKEGDAITAVHSKNKIYAIGKILPPHRTKYQVGKDYVVQTKRGGKGLWYCPKCKKSSYLVNSFGSWKKADSIKKFCECSMKIISENPYTGTFKPLRIKITDIRQEKLLDISEADARAEGFKNKLEFAVYFCGLYKKNVVYEDYGSFKAVNTFGWNPEVWALTF